MLNIIVVEYIPSVRQEENNEMNVCVGKGRTPIFFYAEHFMIVGYTDSL